MEIAMQFISDEQTVGSDTVQDIKDFNWQSLATQAKKGEQIVSMVPAFEKNFWFNGRWFSKFIYWKRCFKKENRLLW